MINMTLNKFTGTYVIIFTSGVVKQMDEAWEAIAILDSQHENILSWYVRKESWDWYEEVYTSASLKWKT